MCVVTLNPYLFLLKRPYYSRTKSRTDALPLRDTYSAVARANSTGRTKDKPQHTNEKEGDKGYEENKGTKPKKVLGVVEINQDE